MASTSTTQLVVATSEELRQQWHSNSAEWIGPLSLEAYIRREEYLLDQDLTKDGGLTPWLLVSQPDEQGARKILCGCESIKKQALVAVKGKVESVICHGVCSVFCPAENRGKGYAGKMISELAQRLKGWKSEEGRVLFSVLYSDIGKEFYSARGWQVFPSAHIDLQPSSQTHDLPAVQYITAEELPELCAQDEKVLRSRLVKQSQQDSSKVVAIIPDARTIQWHNARADFFAKELFNKTLVNKGAVVEISAGRRAWCYWQHRWNKVEQDEDNKLYILHLAVDHDAGDDFSPASDQGVEEVSAKHGDAVEAVAALLAAAQAEAATWNLDIVTHWNPSSLVLAAARLLEPRTAVVHREVSSITSLLWYGEGQWQDVEWACNERFAWC